MSDRAVLDVEKARHPLQELCVDTFIPNDIRLGVEDGPDAGIHGIIVIILWNLNTSQLTGPNCSGKSIYLKTAALIVFMAHIGSFVPARRALVGITDKIFTRIQTRESVGKVSKS